MPSLLERLQSKIELYRLEQRYTRNRKRRSTFISNAVYVDGEYVYQTPNTTGSSTQSSATHASSPVEDRRCCNREEPSSSPDAVANYAPGQKKRNRLSAMPGFGSLSKGSGRAWRSNTVDVREVR